MFSSTPWSNNQLVSKDKERCQTFFISMITFARLRAILAGFVSTISGSFVISVWMNLPATFRFSLVVETAFSGADRESVPDTDRLVADP